MTHTQGLILWTALLLISVAGRPNDVHGISSTNATAEKQIVSNASTRADNDDYRLPSEVVSIASYDIVIKPDFYNNGEVITFTGEVVIYGYYVANVRRLTLHAGNNLRINSVRIDYQSGNGIQILSTDRDEEREFLHINYNSNFFQAFYLTIGYTATFSGDMDGFYKTFYNTGNKERMLLLTQFEPTMARRAFPCFDEPEMKATFKLTIYAPLGYGALSNTPLDKTESTSGTSETSKYVFQRSARMSTYAFAFMLYEQDSYGPTPYGVVSHSQTSIFLWSRKSDIDAGRADYSLPVSARVLDILEQYTDVPFRNFDYNMSKVDQTVVPNMRLQGRANWGLISYRADRLLVDPEEGTEKDKELAEEYVANQLAHQWFGNLVTTSWWDYAWVSEGLSTFFQYWVVNQLHSDWQLMERIVVEQQQSALLADAQPNALAINARVRTPKQVAAKLSGLTYSKGASIILMLNNIMGEENFRDALRSFLSSKKYGTSSSSDFAGILQNYRPGNITFSVRDFVSSWTDNPGYPVVTVTRDYSAGTAAVNQERFIFGQSNVEKHEYYIPIALRQGNNIDKNFLSPNTLIPDFQGLTANNYVLLTNTGYNRVNYDEQNWAVLLSQLKSQLTITTNYIEPLDRAQLIDDSLNLARAGIRTYLNALTFVEYLSEETEYLPWTAAFPGLHFLKRMLVNVDPERSLKAFMLHILSALYKNLGFSNSGTHLNKLLRAQGLHAACESDHQECLQDASAAFRAFLDAGKRPEPDLREVILCFGIQEGSTDDWNEVFNMLATSEVESERADIIYGLGCSKSTEILQMYLEFSMKELYLHDNELTSVISAIYANPLGVDIVLDMLGSNFNNLLDLYGEKALANTVTDLAEYLVTSDQATKMRTLAANHPEMSDELNAAWTVADNNAFWVTNNGQTVVEALKSVTPVRVPSTTNSPQTSTDTIISTTYRPPISEKNYVGLIVVILVIVTVWGLSSVIVIRRYKKII